jgi:hypothetical protein
LAIWSDHNIKTSGPCKLKGKEFEIVKEVEQKLIMKTKEIVIKNREKQEQRVKNNLQLK